MLDNIRYCLLKLIDWKIELLKKFRLFVSGESKYILSDTKWLEKFKKWKKAND